MLDAPLSGYGRLHAPPSWANNAAGVKRAPPRSLIVFAGPELSDWKLSRPVLRGLDGSNPVRLLGNYSLSRSRAFWEAE